MVKSAWIVALGLTLAACTSTNAAKKSPQPATDGSDKDKVVTEEPTLVDNRSPDAGTPPTQGSTVSGTTPNDTTSPSTPGVSNPGTTPVTTPSTPGSNPGTGDNNRVDTGTPPPPPGTPPSYKPFAGQISMEKVNEWVEQDKARRGDNASNFRYAYIPFEFLASEEDANMARVGLSKALNSVAIGAEDIVHPQDVSEGHGIVYAIDLNGLWQDKGQSKWNIVASGQGKRVFSPAPRLDLRGFEANQPVSAARLAYNVLHGGIYNQLIETPSRGRTLQSNLQAGEPHGRLAVKNAITFGPRYAHRRELPDGRALWESYDDFYGRRGEIRWANGTTPRFRYDNMVADYGTVASETWHHMKNGMIAYYIWGNANQERTKAEQSFVVDPLNHKGRDLLTGFCVFCHVAGVQAAPNDMWTYIEEGKVPENRIESAKQYWVSNQELTDLYLKDKKRFQEAMNKVVYGISDGGEDFNAGLVNGSNPKEPCYFLVSVITGSDRRGDVTNYR